MNAYQHIALRRPFVPVALIYIAGLVVGKLVEASLAGLFLSCAITTSVALFWHHTRWLLLGAMIFLFGWLNMNLPTALISPIDLREVVGDQAQIVTVRGVLMETPTQRVFIREERESWRSLAEVKISALRLNRGEWIPAYGRVLTSTSGVLPAELVAGQNVEVDGVLDRPPIALAPGLFDYRSYLTGHGVYYHLKTEDPEHWSAIQVRVSRPLAVRFRAWAQRALAMGLPEQDEALRLQWAMVLGWQTALTGEVAEPFMRSGTMHIFAISGLHIALIAGILVALLRSCGIPRVWCGVLVVPLIWFYTAATGWQASAIRSTVMMTVIILSWGLRRPGDLLNSLAAAGCIILVWDPLQLFQASFQLSFFVVLSIALLVPMLNAMRKKWLKLDPLLPMEVRPAWQRTAIRSGNVVWTAVVTSVAAFLGSAPLIAFYFHLCTPGSVIANLLVVPASALALMSGLGAIITGDWLPFATELFNHSGWWWMKVMVWLSQAAATTPGAWWFVPAPSAITFALYYTVLVLLLASALLVAPWRWWLASLSAGLAVLWSVQWNHARSQRLLTVLPLNGGHAVFSQATRDSSLWLIDCGDDSAVEFVMKPFLQAQGVNRLPNFLLTCGNADQMGGALSLSKLFKMNRVFASPLPLRSTKYREALSTFEVTAQVNRHATNGGKLEFWNVLHPEPADRFTRADDNSVVMAAMIDGVRVLLLSQLSRSGQNALLSRHRELRADVVIAGLPQNGEPLANELIQTIRPRLIIVADSQFPANRRASAELQRRLRRIKIPIVFTRETGAVTLELKDGEFEMRNDSRTGNGD